MTVTITRMSATIRYITSYRCTACGREENGTTTSVELSSVPQLERFISHTPQRSHDMPVGWASHLDSGFTCGCAGSPK